MADTTILVTLNTFDGTVTLSSVLRDAYVSLPAYKSHTEGRNKFNVCYNLGYSWEGITGAMAYTNLTMLRNFGVQVDHNVEISFESFTKLIDYMGGIEIELTEAEAGVVRRARNAHQNPPRNANPAEYHKATGLEALMGYLYLTGQSRRLDQLMRLALPQEYTEGFDEE
jgi:anionic cell wall polymer biosynthesis LytR-Cps2A-Psr (LCP) family protein